MENVQTLRPAPVREGEASPAPAIAQTISARPILRAALTLAEQGWAVFPLQGKRPFAGFRWREQSSADAATVQGMFQARPHANLGIDCGKSGLYVVDLDVDGDVDGHAAWADLKATHHFDDTGAWVVLTGGGGRHLIFQDPTGGALGNTARKLGPGIDTRGNGGYIVAPPSRHPETGRPYRWQSHEATPSPLPDALIALLQSAETAKSLAAPTPSASESGRYAHYVQTAVSTEAAALATALAGSRNDRLFQAAAGLGELVAAPWAHLAQNVVEHVLYAACLTNGLVQDDGESSVRATLSSGLRQGLRQPRPEPVGHVSVPVSAVTLSEPSPTLPDAPAPTVALSEPSPMLSDALTILPEMVSEQPAGWLPLPDSVQLAPELGQDACPWLDNFCAFSTKWSPEAYPGYHEATGVWLLSVVAARRVAYHLGGLKYTPLYILLTARSGLTSKTTTTQVAIKVLQAAGLDWLLTTTDATPQRFISDLTAQPPENYARLSPEQQAEWQIRLAFAGQRGWYYDEFGTKIKAMLRENSVMADFFRLLLVFHEGEPFYEYRTRGRTDRIERPYLALLGNVTPANLQKVAQRGSELWGDGFLARFALVTPPADYTYSSGRFPQERMVIPSSLTTPLQAWHQRLGQPRVRIEKAATPKDAPAEYCVSLSEFPCQELALAADAYEACYAYREALRGLINRSQGMDLDSYYIRLPEKAQRLAALFASLAQRPTLELSHWARAQAIVERWRVSIHHLYDQITAAHSLTEKAATEERIIQVIRNLTAQGTSTPTPNELRRYLHLSVTELLPYLQTLCKAGVLCEVPRQRAATGYQLV